MTVAHPRTLGRITVDWNRDTVAIGRADPLYSSIIRLDSRGRRPVRVADATVARLAPDRA